MSGKPAPDELLIAIHKHCLACSGGSRKEVQSCRIKGCNLYPYRQEPIRQRDKPIKGQISLFDVLKENDHETSR